MTGQEDEAGAGTAGTMVVGEKREGIHSNSRES